MALSVVNQGNAFGAKDVGKPKEEPEIIVYPLDDQDLASKTELVTDPSVRISGSPVVAAQENLDQDYLPPGRYIFAIKYFGTETWDRKHVFLTDK